eukprot:TRINITY_DN28948_c0_g1_i2.p1 TRINITY_DN28948_c0_g1~~TRINITY_DN28948_c0_g1_i2.p1  ORF type:complete len:393 (+),score=30.55 TRINITY_DN28948_c0_g1_i2:149-1327(+)
MVSACDAANVLHARWYNKLLGGWSDTEFWGSACALQATIDFMRVSKSHVFEPLVAQVHELRPANIIVFQSWGSYDDPLWWAGAYLSAHDLLGKKEYLESARNIFDDTHSKAWDESFCGGGMWWSSAKTYKNAITNELAFWLSAELYLTTGVDAYLTIAKRIWQWFSASGMINAVSLINDGLDDTCQNNGQTTWTYNQGVVLGGLIALSRATGNKSMLLEACRIADAAIDHLTSPSGILEEYFLNNRDNVMFKGIFAKHLAHLATTEILESDRQRYERFLHQNANSLVTSDISSHGFFGGSWEGPVLESCTFLADSLQLDGTRSRKLDIAMDSNQSVLYEPDFDSRCASATGQISALHLLNAASKLSRVQVGHSWWLRNWLFSFWRRWLRLQY